jgi:Na+-driven multidrug efflux pump
VSWTIDWRIVGSLCRFGLPAGVQGIATALGGVLLVGFVGSLEHSGEAQAAYAVVYTQLFALVTWTSIGLMSAASVMAGQNLGAGRPDRVIASARIAATAAALISGLAGLLFVAAPGTLLGLFGLTDPLTLTLGVELLRYLGLAAVFFAVGLVYTGVLQGTGDTRGPLWIAVISLILLPLVLCTALQQVGGLQPREVWIAIVSGNLLRYALSWARFRRGGWRSIELAVETAEPAEPAVIQRPADANTSRTIEIGHAEGPVHE